MRHRALAAAFMFSMTLLVTAGASTSHAIELLHWTFDQVDTVDDVVFTTPDSSGRGNTGTLTNMDGTNLVLGRVGNALRFDGGNLSTSASLRDRVQIPTADVNVITDLNRTYEQFTFAAFLQPQGIAEDEFDVTWIAGKMGASTNRGWQLGLTGTDAQVVPAANRHPDDFIVSMFDGPVGATADDNEWYSGPADGEIPPDPPEPTAAPNDEWTHVAITFSGITQTESFFRMYINGVRVDEITPDEITSLPQMNGVNTAAFQVGNRGNNIADSWLGLIDDIYLFDHALTDAEILALIPPEAPDPPGDFNEDGLVDAADYVVYRKNVDGTTPLPNDDGLGTPIGPQHYDLWEAHFGEPGGGGAGGGGNSPIPEPTSALLMAACAAILCGGCSRRIRRTG
jgi:hypothetical protein